jgi:hypothetical protein
MSMISQTPRMGEAPLAVQLAPIWAFCVAVFGCLSAVAETYYAEPNVGSMSNPGTAEQPWSTFEAVAAAGRSFVAGDVLVLR